MPQNKPESAQADKFRDMARELECDEDEAAFEEAVKKVSAPLERAGPDKPAPSR